MSEHNSSPFGAIPLEALGPQRRELKLGERVGRHRVVERLEGDAHTSTYLVVHLGLGSSHVLKVVHVHSPMAQKRLLQEGQRQSRIKHVHLHQVTDAVAIEDSVGLIFETIEGQSLEAWLREHRPGWRGAIEILLGVLRGVTCAHEAGLIHRDLRPANILMTQVGNGLLPKVTGFGLAKSTDEREGAIASTTATMGDPHYTAPEQLLDAREVDQRADLFAAGCILYELVTGSPPFKGASAFEVHHAANIGHYRPLLAVDPSVPVALSALVDALLVAQPERRLASGAVVIEQLLQIANASREGALPPPTDEPVAPALPAPLPPPTPMPTLRAEASTGEPVRYVVALMLMVTVMLFVVGLVLT